MTTNLIALRIYINEEFEKTKSFDDTKDIWKIAELSRDEINLDTLRTIIEHHSFLSEQWVCDLLISDEYICKLASFEYPEIEIDDNDALYDEIETFVDLDDSPEEKEEDITDTAKFCKLRMYFKKMTSSPAPDSPGIPDMSNSMFNEPLSLDINNTICDESSEQKNDFQVALMGSLDYQCSCNFKLGQQKLYFCGKCDTDRVYCNDCGFFLHRSVTGKDHKWGVDIVEVPVINSSKYQNGEKYIINLLGAERYNKIIAPKLRAFSTKAFTINNAATAVNSGKNIYVSYNVGKAYSEAVSAANKFGTAAFEAIKTEQVVANAAEHAVKAANEAKEAVQHAKAMREIYTVGSTNNPFYWLYSWLYKDHADEACKIYEEAVAARDLAHSKAAQYAKDSLQARNAAAYSQQKAQLAKQFAESKKAEATTAATAAQDSMKLTNSLKSAACVSAGLTVLEMFIHGYKYGNKQISGKEFWRLSGKSLTRNTASMVGTTIGTQIGGFTGSQLGAVLGESVCPGFGTIAGAGVGLLAGMFLSWKLGAYAENIYERVFPSGDEKTRKDLIHEALIYFHFTEEDIDNPQVFNSKRIKKEYRNAALNAHPDRNEGNYTKWNILSTNYGILMGLLEQNNENKEIIKNTVIQSLIQ